MAIPLKYNTASQEITLGQALDSTDGDTEESGLTIANTDIKLWKAGATTLASKNSGGATYISNGVYYAVLDATDTNTYGPLVIYVHVAGALAMKVECVVMNATAYDALYGTDSFDVNVSSWTATLGLDDDYPATQAQVGNISIGSAAIGANAGGAVITTGIETLTYTATAQRDGVFHEVADDGGNTDFYYTVTTPGNATATAVKWAGYVQSNGDDVELQFYNWTTTSYVTEKTLSGTNGTTIVDETISAVSAYTGTGSDIGKVRFRFLSTTSTNVATDRLIFEYTVTSQTAGYDGGQAWIDTVRGNAGTELFVNATADNPVDSIADATTIAAALNLQKYHVANDSTITFASSRADETWVGSGWTLLLGGQDVSQTHIHHCNDVTGIGTTPTGEVHILDSHIGAVTLDSAHITRCQFSSTFTAGAAGDFFMEESKSGVAGVGSPTFDFSGNGPSSTINAKPWNGGGATWIFDADCTASIEVTHGGTHTITTGGADVEFRGSPKSIVLTTSGTGNTDLVIDNGAPITINGTGGTVVIYGMHGLLIDNSSGTTIIDLGADMADITALAKGRILASGTAQGGTSTTMQLTAGTVTYDNQFINDQIIAVEHTAAGLSGIVTSSVAATDTVTFAPAWPVSADATTDYQLTPAKVNATISDGGYDGGFVYVNVVGGSPGQQRGISGTIGSPSSVLADARAIADVEKINQFDIKGGGLVTLDQAYTDWVFDVKNPTGIDLNGKDVGNSVFLRTGIFGTSPNTNQVTFELCGVIAPLSVGNTSFISCGLGSTITLTGTSYAASFCVAFGVSPVVIDVNGDGVTPKVFKLQDFNGDVELQNMSSVDEIIIYGNSRVTINANCTGGTLTRAGDVVVTNNSGGSVSVVNGIIADIEADVDTLLAGVTVTDAGGNKIADHVLRRAFATAAASADGDTKDFRSLLGAVAKLVNKVSISGPVLIVTEANDTTTFGTQTLTTDPTADPITGADTN